ncbi:MAG: hypothetical protein Kow0089_22900 [Desulfobulbaceae bacterium]
MNDSGRQQGPSARGGLLRLVPLLLGLLLAVGLHAARTVTDAADLDRVVRWNTPKELLTDARYGDVRTAIFERPVYLKPDAYYWILYAQDLVRKQTFRLRHSEYDNVPFGREIAWNSGYLWYLVLLGKIDSLFSGRELLSGIEHAGRWANPLLVAIFATFWGLVIGLRWGPWAGGLFPLMFLFCGATLPEMTFGFGDHHALHISLATSQLLAVLMGGAGFVSSGTGRDGAHDRHEALPADFPTARRWFVAAGIFGAAGLWVGASQQALVIGMIGYGGCLAALLCNRESPSLQGSGLSFFPSLWRWWGWTGALGSCLFYLVEYFPGHLGMRLEVNHPLYALAWLGGAELVCRITSLTTGERKRGAHCFLSPGLFLAFAALCALPLMIALGPASWHVVHDPVVLRWHDSIYEFMSFFDPRVGSLSFTFLFERFGLYPLVLLVSTALLFVPSRNRGMKALLVQAWLPAVLLLGLYLYEVRWGTFFATSLIVLATVFTTVLPATAFGPGRKPFRRQVTALLLVLFLLPHWLWIVRSSYSGDPAGGVQKRFFTLSVIFLARELALNFRILAPDEEIRLLGAGSLAPILAYYGAARSVGSPYWPNYEGIRDDTSFYAAFTDKEARVIVEKRGVTHALFEAGSLEEATRALWTARGTYRRDDLRKTLAWRFLTRAEDRPDWLHPVPLPVSRYIRKYNLVVTRIDPPNG